MPDIQEGDLLWQPSPEIIENANLTRFRRWINAHHGLDLADYDALWRWSVTEIATFWDSVRAFFDIHFSQPAETVLAERAMPGAQWFTGARLNYAENILRKRRDDQPMMLFKAEDAPLQTITWHEASGQVRQLAAALRGMGVQRGDRVVSTMPNIPQTIIALLAVTSIGAIWSSASPDFGAKSVLDRFQQIEPKILLAVDGYRYGGKVYDRRAVVAELQAKLPSLEKTILVPFIAANTGGLTDTVLWDAALANADDAPLRFEPVPFDHPLWVLYSSGTTGLPKPIVHGHGGILLEHAKATALHNDLRAGDRFFWYTSTGWMMWNYLVGALLSGATIIVYDGSPAYPDMNVLWQLAEETGMTYFGTSAAFVSACMNEKLTPDQAFDLSAIRGVGSTGSPLTVSGFGWIYENVNAHLALESLSGGTDLCTAFVGGARTKPIYAGEIQGASLGAKVQAYDESGEPVIDEVGELVITEPMPSMPVYFWNDRDNARYTSAYFEMFPGVWRHGDWIQFNGRGGCVIYGRSDSTINRQGIRMGTSEIYEVVEGFDEVLDSLVIDLEYVGRESFMPLFVVLRDGVTLDDDLINRVKRALRENVSPRHVPNEIIAVEQIPYTLSGKKMEVPVRKILLGVDVEKAANRGAMRNPDAIDFFLSYSERLAQTDSS